MTPTAPTDNAENEEVHVQEPGQQDYGEDNKDLPEEIIRILKEVTKEIQNDDESGKYVRRLEVMREWRNSLYEQGTQHIQWTGGSSKEAGGFSVIYPGGPCFGPDGAESQAPRFVDDYDIVGPYCNILTSVQTQDTPALDFRPKNSNLPEDVSAAEEAEIYRSIYEEQNDVTATDTEIYRKLLLSGRMVAWTRTETDPERFGYLDDDKTQPRSFECTDIYGTVDSRVPLTAKNQRKCYYCILVEDQDVNIWKSKYPDYADKIKPGECAIGENIYERNARLGVIHNAGSFRGRAYQNLTARSNVWLRPSNWFRECVTKAGFQEELTRLFPLGCHITWIGEQYVGSWAESMDDHLTIIGGIRPNQGMFQEAIIDPIIVEQDAVNDAENVSRLIADTGWGRTYWGADDEDIDAVNRQRASPGAITQLKELPAGVDAKTRFFQEKQVEVNEWFINWKQTLRTDWPQFQLSAQPTLQGGTLKENDTASGYAQANKNAIGSQGPAFRVKESAWASIYYQAALACRESGSQEQLVARDGRPLNMDRFNKGKFGVYPDRDGGFPESTPARRQIMQTIALSPMGPAVMGVPKNARTALDLMGFSDLVIPEAEAAEKQMIEIQELLESGPTPPDPVLVQQLQAQHAIQAVQMAQTGQQAQPFQPPPPKSTITPQPLDFHGWEFQACQDWLSGPECRKQVQRGNQAGVENVRAHAMEHWTMKLQVPFDSEPPLIAVPPAKGAPQPGTAVPAAPGATATLS